MKIRDRTKLALVAASICFLNCSKWIDKTDYVVELNKFGWESKSTDSTLILFSSVTECAPCNDEINYWNQYNLDEANQLEIILVVSEKYKTNYESFLKENNLNLNTFMDSTNVFREKNLIPFIPYKVLLTEKGAQRIGEIGYVEGPSF